MRLTHALEYRRVYDAKVRKGAGAIIVHVAPNGRPHHRLGLAVGKSVGSAVARNRVKRLVREAFRLSWRAWPGAPAAVTAGGAAGAGGAGGAAGAGVSDAAGLDVVVSVRGHADLTLDEVRAMLARAVAEGASVLRKRAQRAERGS